MGRVAGGGSSKTGSLTVKFKYLFLLTVVLAGGFLILSSHKTIDIIFIDTELASVSWKSHRYDIVNTADKFTIETEGCCIPALKPIDDSIKKMVYYPLGLTACANETLALLDHDKNRIWVKTQSFRDYNISDEDELLCCYQPFYRPVVIEDITSTRVDHRAKYHACTYFNDTVNVRDEFVRVACQINKEKIYEQYFVFAPEKQFIKHNNKGELPQNVSAYNILVLGIDAVSRLNFHRTMPNTVKFLKNKGAVELLGYNKVGDNTFPNLMPMLLGYKDTELEKTCLPHSKATFDNCPFVWEWFKQAGYYTALGEDSSFLGTFNYAKVGFSNTPTDYYLHTFIHEAEHHVGKNKDFNSLLCMNDKYFYKVLLDYIEDLTTTLKHKKLFGFFWETTLSHDYLNYPMAMDNDYEKFLKSLEKSKYLNDTIVLVVSDHGIRWGEIRSTKQGRLEERLPFLFILMPPSFREGYNEAYKNLHINRKRLTTPFDVHATLSDLVNLKNVKNEAILTRGKKHYAQDRSISLFIPIPSNRTCATAGIDDHWCTCHKNVPLSKDSKEATEAASNLVLILNDELREYPQCARLSLSDVLNVMELQVGKRSNEVGWWREYMVVAKTHPGDGVFEATLRHDNQKWKLAGTPSRLNLYGDQSQCMDNYQLKLYCYCI